MSANDVPASEDADQLREQGNEKFKAKEFDAAIELYTRSLELKPDCHRCYSNRCAASCTLKTNLDQALSDAQKCVELKPDWGKGYLRVCEALSVLKRAGESKPWLEKGLQSVPSEDTTFATMEKNLKEVPKWEFVQALRGTWHGTVNEVLGGYDQEMEFLENDSEVRVDVLGRSIIGKFWVDVAHDPHHLNIQVPHQQVPPGMPPPPPVPYIARIDSVGLHLCCPYLKMERPAEFTGPGYVLMKAGGMAAVDDSEVANLSHKDKLLRCTQELLKAIPSRKLEEVSQTDSEDAAGEKLMAQVRFESTMFSIQRQFGEAMVKEVISSVKSCNVPPELEGVQEIKELAEKMKMCGLLEEEDAPKAHDSLMQKPGDASTSGSTAAAKSSTAAAGPTPAQQRETKSAEAGNQRRAEAPLDPASDSLSCTQVATGVLAAAGFALMGFMYLQRRNAARSL